MQFLYKQKPLTDKRLNQAKKLIVALGKIDQPNQADFLNLLRKYSDPVGGMFAKSDLNRAYTKLLDLGQIKPLPKKTLILFKKRPVRTLSGVAPVTVLTKPFPCPGECIFCPSDVRMPKSYLADEPGAQRAERNFFDPYLQTLNRLKALAANGHLVDKAELIILGGTWSFYPEKYQIWFVKECFRALNDFASPREKNQVKKRLEFYKQLDEKLQTKNLPVIVSDSPEKRKVAFADKKIDGEKLKQNYNQVVSKNYLEPEKELGLDRLQSASWTELELEQKKNETAKVRCVGLVLETRPDNISETEVIRLRRLGATKTQIGVQSLDDEVLLKNKRGHDVATTRRAFRLLRLAGFKIHAHWMANLYGSDVAKDKKDYLKLFTDQDFKPDELKIYPTSLIASAELMQYFKKGLWQPYDFKQLLEVLEFALTHTPPYCRLTRVVRDIPATDIVVGNKKTNFRQIVTDHISTQGKKLVDIRAREIRQTKFSPDKIKFDVIDYDTSVSQEKFLEFVVETDEGEKLLAFLRLSLLKKESFIDELKGKTALIREIHVYGRLTGLGQRDKDKAQHLGLGTKLIEKAKKIAKEAGYEKLAVISAVGTREYYRRRGFQDVGLYQVMKVK